MDKNRVLEALRTLHAELLQAQPLDDSSRQSLLTVTEEIRRQLETNQPLPRGEEDSFASRLQDSILELEAEHPQVTAAINQVAAALANLGI